MPAACARAWLPGNRLSKTSAAERPRPRLTWAMHRAKSLVPATTPWVAIASANARSTMLSCPAPSPIVVPTSPQHTSEMCGTLLTCSPPGPPPGPPARDPEPAGPLLVVARGGLRPQVELGTVGLHLPPERESA